MVTAEFVAGLYDAVEFCPIVHTPVVLQERGSNAGNTQAGIG